MRLQNSLCLTLVVLVVAGCGDDTSPSEGDSGGTGGAGGAANPGEPACIPAYRAITLALIGDRKCVEFEQCITVSCATEFNQAAGAGWQDNDYSGGICEQYVSCVDACDCETNCSGNCRDQYASRGPCLDAAVAVAQCRNNACPDASDGCIEP